MSQQLVLGVPAFVGNLVQSGLLERAFHDNLYPALQYRAEAQAEKWDANTGTEIFMSRPGLLAPIVKPIAPGVDPIPQTVAVEQWVARLARYAGTIDTHMPTSAVAAADLFMRNIHQLGQQAGQSLNRIPRNELFKAYLSGQTVTTAAGITTDTSIQVASLNGFTDVVLRGTNVRPSAVSTGTPLAVTIGGVTGTRNVIGFTPFNADDPFGPGTLQLDAQLGANIAARQPVISAAAPKIIRAGGGLSVDAIGASDTLFMQDVINAAARLRRYNVLPHEDGFYHAHISPEVKAQLYTDPAFQRLYQGVPDNLAYREGYLGQIAGVVFFENNETPDSLNSGERTSTGTAAFYSTDVGAETTNEAGVNVARTIITGRGSMYEKWLDESAYVSEAGVTGKIGEFTVVNAGVEVQTERIRLILRAPLNRLQDAVAASWSITTSFPIPSDVSAGGPEKFKRAIVIESAADVG